jgi:hypothetical protein
MAIDVLDLTTVAAVKLLTGAASADDTNTQTLITKASVWANNHTSRILAQQTFTEIYDGDGSVTLFLKNYPISSITTIHQDSTRVFGVDTLVASTDYFTYAENRKLIGDGVVWERGRQTIKVVYIAGYAIGSIPEDLVNAVTMLVDFWGKEYSAHRFGVTSTGSETNRITYEKNIPVEIKEMLNPYKKKVIF